MVFGEMKIEACHMIMRPRMKRVILIFILFWLVGSRIAVCAEFNLDSAVDVQPRYMINDTLFDISSIDYAQDVLGANLAFGAYTEQKLLYVFSRAVMRTDLIKIFPDNIVRLNQALIKEDEDPAKGFNLHLSSEWRSYNLELRYRF